MRFLGFAVVTGAAILLGACGGGETTPAADAPATEAPAAETPAATEAPAAGASSAITGTIHTVNMVMENNVYKFSPTDITVKQGDGIKFVMVSGGPHNVAFDPTLLPADVKAQLIANMPEQSSELIGPMMLTENQEYTISFAGVTPGTYEFYCTPHLAMGMKGKVTVTQ
jgi:plastocyanin